VSFATKVRYLGSLSVLRYVRHIFFISYHRSLIRFFNLILTVLVLSVILAILYYRRRRQRSTFGAGTDPAMNAVPYSRGATFASAYDPNGPQYPAPTYAFVGHGAVSAC
jgi:hypothetical protein